MFMDYLRPASMLERFCVSTPVNCGYMIERYKKILEETNPTKPEWHVDEYSGNGSIHDLIEFLEPYKDVPDVHVRGEDDVISVEWMSQRLYTQAELDDMRLIVEEGPQVAKIATREPTIQWRPMVPFSVDIKKES